MATGTIKFFDADRGFGFIAPDDGGADLFVHVKNCTGIEELSQGQRVQFEERASKRKGGKFEAYQVALL